jgi:hypothetical protein
MRSVPIIDQLYESQREGELVPLNKEEHDKDNRITRLAIADEL